MLLGSLKMWALCAIYLASQINAEMRLGLAEITRYTQTHTHTREGDAEAPESDRPVESVQESQFDGVQVGGVGDNGAVGRILDQVDGPREGSSNVCKHQTRGIQVRLAENSAAGAIQAMSWSTHRL